MAQDKTTATGGGDLNSLSSDDLDTLDWVASELSGKGQTMAAAIVTKAARAALAASSPPSSDGVGVAAEPVAWAWDCLEDGKWALRVSLDEPGARRWHRNIRPLYEHPLVAAEPVAEAIAALRAIKATGQRNRLQAPQPELSWKNAVVQMEREAETALSIIDAALAAAPSAPTAGAGETDEPVCYMCDKPIGAERAHVHPEEGFIHERCCSDEDSRVPMSDALLAAAPSAPREIIEGKTWTGAPCPALAPSASTAGAAVAGVAGDLDGLGARAAEGPWWHQALGDYGEAEDRFITDGKSNLATDVCEEEAAFIVALVNAYRTGQLVPAASRTEVGREEIGALGSDPGAQGAGYTAEDALRSLASWLGVGGYNAPKVDPAAFEDKIRAGVDLLTGPWIKDAQRYRKLRGIGAAPGGTLHLEKALVFVSTNLDAWLDAALAGRPIAPAHATEFDPSKWPKVEAETSAPDPGAQGDAVAWAVPDGWDLVPKEPTEEMWLAGQQADAYPGDSYVAVWDAMLAAAPAAPRSADMPGREEIAKALYEHDTAEPRFLWPIQNERMAANYRSRADAILKLLPPRGAGAETRADGGGA